MSGGKQFAKRATMWDAVFVGIGSMSRRDEGLASIIARSDPIFAGGRVPWLCRFVFFCTLVTLGGCRCGAVTAAVVVSLTRNTSLGAYETEASATALFEDRDAKITPWPATTVVVG